MKNNKMQKQQSGGMQRIKVGLLIFFSWLIFSCSDSKNLTEIALNTTPQFSLDEKAALLAFENSLLTLKGKVRDINGLPIENALVSIVDSINSTSSASDGSFIFTSLARKNILLSIQADGFRGETLVAYLQLPITMNEVELPSIILDAAADNKARFLFGGDTAFGRRFLDPDETTLSNAVPPDNPAAQILSSDPEPGTRQVVAELRPHYQEADWGVLNFETPVTDNPATPHPNKEFVFFTLPKSLPALNWLGVDYVSSGNNHVYDYLELGVTDTIDHLNTAGLAFSGIGLNSSQAFTAYRQNIKGSDYSFLSMTSVDGRQFEVNYVAEANKGGAADLNQDTEVVAAIQGEFNAAQIPIVQYHAGAEYTFEPTSYVINRIGLAATENIPLLVIHHPHVAQGVGLFDNTHTLLGLGNLAFDQARLETMLGVMGRVDMRAANVEQIRLLPVYLENFAPKLISGGLANDFLRRLGEFSHDYNGLLYPYNGQGWVSMTADDYVAVERSITVNIDIAESGSTTVDLRAWLEPGESLSSVVFSDALTLQRGRDLLLFGDFEDWDKDPEFNEVSRWELSGDSRFACMSQAYRDTIGLCILRKFVNTEASIVAFRNRIRVMGDAQNTPNKDLSLIGYYKAENSGPISIVSRYYASSGELEFGEEVALASSGGTFDWIGFHRKLNMPADVYADPALDARGLRLFIQQSPPATGDGLAAFDELAVVAWEDLINSAQQLKVPHPKDFLKVSGTPGNYQLTVQLKKIQPAASQ